MPRPWPADAEGARRRARYRLRARLIGVGAGVVMIIVVFAVSHAFRPTILFGSIFAGTTLLSLGSFWLEYHLLKLGAIKKAASGEV